MHYTVKTLLEQGRSQRSIARELGISRETVRRIMSDIDAGLTHHNYQRPKSLDGYRDVVQELLSNGLTGVLIHQRLDAVQYLPSSLIGKVFER